MSDSKRDSISEKYEKVEHPRQSRQLSFMRSAQMSLFAKITSYPPLGELTCVKRAEGFSSPYEDDKVSLLAPVTEHLFLIALELDILERFLTYPDSVHGHT